MPILKEKRDDPALFSEIFKGREGVEEPDKKERFRLQQW